MRPCASAVDRVASVGDQEHQEVGLEVVEASQELAVAQEEAALLLVHLAADLVVAQAAA